MAHLASDHSTIYLPLDRYPRTQLESQTSSPSLVLSALSENKLIDGSLGMSLTIRKKRLWREQSSL